MVFSGTGRQTREWTEKVTPPPSCDKRHIPFHNCGWPIYVHTHTCTLTHARSPIFSWLVSSFSHSTDQMRIRITPFNRKSPLSLSPFPLRGLSALVSCHPCDIIHNVRDMCLALATAPCTDSNQIPPLWYHAPTISRAAFPLSFGFFFPKVCQDQQIPQASVPCQPPTPSSPTPAPRPPTRLLVHMQRKEASPLWQQQNTTLQKRCAPLTVTIKKGVDRIRAGDDDLRGRDVQKEARREEKGLSFLCLLFFSYLFFHFPRIHQAPLDTCLTGVALISPEGGVPFSPLHATPSRSPFLFPSIYISKQAMSRSKTVTNDEAFHQWLAWYTEIVCGEVSLIISRWVCCLALVCVLLGSCHYFILSLSLGARRRWRGMCQWVSQENVFVIRKPYMPVN